MNNKGSILIVVINIVMLAAVLGAVLFALMMARDKEIHRNESRLRASYLAEAGLEIAIAEVSADADLDNDGIMGTVAVTGLGAGLYSADYDGVSVITGIGIVDGITKEVEVEMA